MPFAVILLAFFEAATMRYGSAAAAPPNVSVWALAALTASTRRLYVTPIAVPDYSGLGTVEMNWQGNVWKTAPKKASVSWNVGQPTWAVETDGAAVDASLEFALDVPGVRNRYTVSLSHFIAQTCFEDRQLRSPDGAFTIGVRILREDDPSLWGRRPVTAPPESKPTHDDSSFWKE